ncbi:biotin--[acetyl-CoA-carboxylase] ligase [Caldibacillus lycopersici]|uniref:Bifunctional ligase/repressor BirA n=1 Tax=Perspicuibacillus lycopersici TaxID=1325689 RepID=A0AAE3IS90_9BACI|nr:biotin--[acetyl-CoA-carboxylase] ligase [Perspicuibacillus lycopersici]MCU9613688.1 biotin--[acetyl-CoA-carboxylase] ligase [Perspicuibacillus lycopersici]
MKSTVRQNLLDAFRNAAGEFISGEKLANTIGCSRTAVWKHIEELRNEGFEVEAIRKKGYRLAEHPNTLTENEIYLGLQTKYIGKTIHFYESLPSTQQVAKELALNGATEGTLVISDEQTLGRGRLARAWHSPKGTGIWTSIIIRPKIPIQQAPQLTLLTAVAAVQAIEEQTDIDVSIKWPNDLLINGKKVCGILTELQAEENQIQSIIIGIGINVNQQLTDFPEELHSIATSLSMEVNDKINRAKLVQSLCFHLEKLYETYLTLGFQPIKLLWESYALSIGKQITARTLNGTYSGIALGINEQGVLLLETSDGKIQHIYSADIEIDALNR